MTKKNIFLVLFVVIFFTIMAISVWGKNPESSGNVPATEIIFYDQLGQKITEENISQFKEKVVTLDKDGDNPKQIIYYFSLELLPANTTDTLVVPSLRSEAKLEEINTPINEETKEDGKEGEGEEKHPTVYYYKITFEIDQQELTTIDFAFNTTTVKKHAYLMFKWHETHEDDIG